jgi:hypothetical protein
MKSSIEPVPHDRSNSKHLTDWRLYAAAGAAALAAGSAADAAIIYTDPTVKPTSIGHSAGISYLRIGSGRLLIDAASSLGHEELASWRTNGKFFRANGSLVSGAFPNAKNYNLNAPIGGGVAVPGVGLHWTSTGGKKYGNFQGGQPGFIGFELANGDLGWLRVEVTADDQNVTAIDWAYNDVAGAPINAGQTSSAVPEPSALGLLALGSAGVLAWRRRRTAPAR